MPDRAAPFGVAEANAILPSLLAPWVQAAGLRVDRVGPDEVVMRMPHHDDLARVGGPTCGQALMTLADTCMIFVISARLGGFREMATTNQSISFLRPIVGVDAIARGRAFQVGRTLAFGEVVVFADGDDRVAAHATSTYALAPRPPATD